MTASMGGDGAARRLGIASLERAENLLVLGQRHRVAAGRGEQAADPVDVGARGVDRRRRGGVCSP